MSTQWQKLKPSDLASKEEQHMLRQRSDMWGAWLFLHCWGVIALAMALYALFPHIVTLLAGIIIVGGRQLGLAILMHEASHALLFKSRNLNERIGQWLTAWPMLLDLQLYRKRHMAHHRFTRTEKDPENYLYTPFPVAKASMARKLVRDLTGIAFLRTQVGIFIYRLNAADGDVGEVIKAYMGPLSINALMATGFAAFGRLDLWLLLWLLPMATTYMAFLRIRNIAEHANMPSLDDPLRNSRTTYANWLERATVAPYWVNYHIEHHMLPFVPCYRLKQVHQMMLDRGFGPAMEIRDGYTDIIRLNTGQKLLSEQAMR